MSLHLNLIEYFFCRVPLDLIEQKQQARVNNKKLKIYEINNLIALKYKNKSIMQFVSMEGPSGSTVKCKNPSYECSRPVEKGQGYCILHVLKGTAPTGYRRCSFVTLNGNQCTNARPADPG